MRLPLFRACVKHETRRKFVQRGVGMRKEATVVGVMRGMVMM